MKTNIRIGLCAIVIAIGVFVKPVFAEETVSDNAFSSDIAEIGGDTQNDISEAEIDLDAEEKGVAGFVTRLYKVCLKREPDAAGKADWINKLNTKERNGIQVAYGFIFSNEFQRMNLCDSDYVEYLYEAFMGRKSDPAGKADWINRLRTGKTREEVFNGFALSDEFRGLCNEYGIVVGEGIEIPQYGTVPHGACSVCGEMDGVTAFVTRLYNVCLDRNPDQAGLEDWTNQLWSHESEGVKVAFGFVFSNEFINKNLSESDFIEYLYRAFFDRNSDAGGKEYWMEQMLYNGMNKSHVFAGFANSKEFKGLCERYGIVQGTYTPVDDELTPDYVARMSYAAREKLIMGEYYGQSTLTKAQADSRMTVITVPVWDFLNTRSMTKVSKTATLTCNKGVAEYFKKAFEELYNHPSQPVIHPGSFYAYSYRANVNNPSVLSNHSYGTAIDINPGENPNGKAMVTAAAWAAMPQGSVNEMQKKAYTIYEGSPYYEVLYKKYHLYWLGYNRTVDAMHFEF